MGDPLDLIATTTPEKAWKHLVLIPPVTGLTPRDAGKAVARGLLSQLPVRLVMDLSKLPGQPLLVLQNSEVVDATNTALATVYDWADHKKVWIEFSD